MPVFRHAVMRRYDSTLDYEGFAKFVCGEHPCLIMMETKGGEHVHFQGMSDLSKAALKKFAKEWGNNHVLKKRKREDPNHKDDKNFHPVCFKWEDIDWTGFQYCCKEYSKDSVVVYKQGFTEEDLIRLHDSSNLHRDRITAKLGEFVSGRIDPSAGGSPQELHFSVASAAFDYYVAEAKIHPPNLKQLVRALLYKMYPSDAVRVYLIRLCAM